MMRHREQLDVRRQPEGFKPSFMESREQEMRMNEMGSRGAINMGDSFNPVAAVSGNPSQMGLAGRVGAMGPEGSSNMGTPLIPDNGVMHKDRFSEGSPLQMGSSVAGRSGVDSPQQQQVVGAGPVPGVAGQSGFARGSPVGGNFDGPNNKRRRY
ncbi:paraspeckle component 1-like isoform X1 [Sinocyclocheilus grahami]|uniref:paraspeckle component 1-like isoform X1 n=1 Tax=Sinocyclocheilus grahami TaxID=75366 RepID=UPI0007ACAA21|nr:PREDICTED: paraspeckle component 1-like isoform X1 [Sinocyclocheilus grahami]